MWLFQPIVVMVFRQSMLITKCASRSSATCWHRVLNSHHQLLALSCNLRHRSSLQSLFEASPWTTGTLTYWALALLLRCGQTPISHWNIHCLNSELAIGHRSFTKDKARKSAPLSRWNSLKRYELLGKYELLGRSNPTSCLFFDFKLNTMLSFIQWDNACYPALWKNSQ